MLGINVIAAGLIASVEPNSIIVVLDKDMLNISDSQSTLPLMNVDLSLLSSPVITCTCTNPKYKTRIVKLTELILEYCHIITEYNVMKRAIAIFREKNPSEYNFHFHKQCRAFFGPANEEEK